MCILPYLINVLSPGTRDYPGKRCVQKPIFVTRGATSSPGIKAFACKFIRTRMAKRSFRYIIILRTTHRYPLNSPVCALTRTAAQVSGRKTRPRRQDRKSQRPRCLSLPRHYAETAVAPCGIFYALAECRINRRMQCARRWW